MEIKILYTINDWDILDIVIGQGSWSTVYRVLSAEPMCCKIIPKEKLQFGKDKKFITNEINFLTRLNEQQCNNIVRLIYATEDEKNYYMFLEYVQGKTLFDVLCDVKLSRDQIKFIFFQVLKALYVTHKAGIVHRDVKLENILISSDYNRAVLCDYGLAANWTNGYTLTDWVGSPLYAAPQLINKEPYDCSIDVWSLGIVLYTMLHGIQPFYSSEISQVFTQICYKSPEYSSNTTFEERDLINRMLDKDQKTRIDIESIIDHPFFC
jgi:serine/threonine protein kinase